MSIWKTVKEMKVKKEIVSSNRKKEEKKNIFLIREL